MTRLQWDQPEERFYEAGLDRGVLYLSDGSGVPWNGLVSVKETNDGDTSTPFYVDGVKYIDHHVIGDYLATLEAFTYPDEFLEYEGQVEIDYGVFAGEQPPKTFSLSYRTKISHGLNADAGYQIHVVYNLTAVPSDKAYSTLSNTPTPMTFTWEIAATPEAVEGFRPTAHVIIDSRYMHKYAIANLETLLYGSNTKNAHLPELYELLNIAQNWRLIRIIDNGDDTWTAIGPDEYIREIDEGVIEIENATITPIDANSYYITDTV